MQLIRREFGKDGFYTLEFRKKDDTTITDIIVEFENHFDWSMQSEEQYAFGENASFHRVEKTVPFPREVTRNLYSISLHIPNPDGRTMFKACMDFFIKRTHAPMHVGIVEHPGYPLVIINFDAFIVGDDFVNELIDQIMNGIKLAPISIQEIEREEVKQEEDLDDIDENNIIEYEEDEELKAIMKAPVDRTIKPLGGSMYD